MIPSVELVHVYRGDYLDNVHRGSVAIADVDGRVVASVGDPEKHAFIRSAGKPLQALALIERGGVERFGLTPPEVAIICASHSGGPKQVATMRSILAKIGVPESALRSGEGIRDNCSGKHAGMLALATMLNLPIEDYDRLDHPIQQTILSTVSEMCGLTIDEIGVAVDGCGAPIFAMPLRNMAVGYARLANPEGLPPERAKACRTIVQCMIAHPEMVGGLDLRPFTGESIVAKAGASGCYCAGLRGERVGFAMKIDDGNSSPIHLVFFEMLRRHGYISDDVFRRYLEARPPKVRNRRGDEVGHIEIVF